MIETPLATDYEGKARNPKWERELFNWLRKQTEETRFTFLMELVKYQVTVALQLAHKTLESRASFVGLLEFAVTNCDASSIRYWLDSVVPRLGFRRTADNLLRLSESEMDGVLKAMYWLPQYASSDADQVKLSQLEEVLSGRRRNNPP
ncbi:MAG TPA: hypothetical protein VMY42_00455 [Thermoguttaceae bacterium]|nr:hypothetical protein [Thermoguttaceae bacterium]